MFGSMCETEFTVIIKMFFSGKVKNLILQHSFSPLCIYAHFIDVGTPYISSGLIKQMNNDIMTGYLYMTVHLSWFYVLLLLSGPVLCF